MKLSIILPTYNEKETVVKTVREVINAVAPCAEDFELLVIDDDSPDGTAALIEREFKDEPRVRCILRIGERGYASAFGRGLKEARAESILFMDSDGNHDPSYLPLMIYLHKYFDVVSGSRYVWGGNMEGPRIRYWGSYFLNLVARVLLRLKTRDNLSEFVIFRRSLLDGLDIDKTFRGFGEFYIAMLYHLKRKKASLLEIPVIYPEREGGKSKMKFFSYFFAYLWRIIKILFFGI